MQLGEIAVVMIIFFGLVAFGVLFYVQSARHGVKAANTEVEQLNLIEAVKLVSSLPELHCSAAGKEDLTCIDLYRAEAFANRVNGGQDQYHYSELFAGFKADLQCVYPQPCITAGINDYALFDYTGKGASEQTLIVPVNILNATGGRGFGMLVITQVTQ